MTYTLRAADLPSALSSLTAAFGVDAATLTDALPVAVARYDAGTPGSADDLYEYLAEVLKTVPVLPEQVASFHGTRLIDPTRVRNRGLLPVTEAVEQIWDDLAALAPELTPTDFADLRAALAAGRHTDKYALRIGGPPVVQGPNSFWVRPLLLAPRSDWPYLKVPEMVHDIATAADRCFGIDLPVRFHEASKPYIVEFVLPASDPACSRSAVAAAAWYASAALRNVEPSSHSAGGGHDGYGAPVPPEAIVDVVAVAEPADAH
jgi:hypothetical protein